MCAFCPVGHALEKKVTAGLNFFAAAKTCSGCAIIFATGNFRHSCRPCNYHLCSGCFQRMLGSMEPALMVPPPPAAPPPSGGLQLCKFGARCYNKDPEHRRRFQHPESGTPEEARLGGMRRACKYGAECYQRSLAHLEGFAHPGDRCFREGLVIFEPGQQPRFETLWQLFQFHDPDESGHLSAEEFRSAMASCAALGPSCLPGDPDQAWRDVGGPPKGFVNFRQFAAWTQTCLGLEYPLGLEASPSSGASRPCRFKLSSADGVRCGCPGYQPAPGGAQHCICGHKPSLHRSDLATRTLTRFFEDDRGGEHWARDEDAQIREGLVLLEDPGVLGRLQDLLLATHKTSDNWTRDRGCKLHGVNGCSPACASRNRLPVPTGYRLVACYRNQNEDLWKQYSLMRIAIGEECKRPCEQPMETRSVVTSGRDFEGAAPDEAVNEWYLFHGSSWEKCRSICQTNFRLALAGSGATWKDAGSAKGTPLYGFGIYFAERVTKADEYSDAVPAAEGFLVPESASGDPYCVLLCRVLGGRTNVVTSNEIEVDKLRSDVFEGPYNSVLGDRVTSLGKPYREIVVYDKDQVFPEFLLVYSRTYD
mmetsp:Transcript_46757/g.99911  ORF Transcript_46757/g.99911 Transcript_46757/m.99911 type:complete len:591 (-) Transcript_46757:83-1855(-)